ncbi:MAG: NAD(P)-dependent alcohol dehydrogenase [Thermoleophilia bacterium]
MRAIVHDRYGPPNVLKLQEIEKPEVVDDAVLVRVHAASVNRLDWYGVTGTPYVARVLGGLRKPKDPGLGVDFAGTVEAVGKDVTHVRPGEEVFGGRTGAFAEYVLVRDAVAPKPANLTFEEAAAVPVAALTALQGFRDKAQLQPGQTVLVNGASGGVGTFAIQIAKALGAEVTAVCSTRNVEQARALGADHVVDYTCEDFTRSERRYDVLFDVAGSRSWRASKRVLKPEGILVMAGAPKGNRMFAPLGRIARVRLASSPSSQKFVFFVANLNTEDLGVLRELIEAGKVTPAVERRYELSEVADGLAYMGEGHARAKIVITVPGV